MVMRDTDVRDSKITEKQRVNSGWSGGNASNINSNAPSPDILSGEDTCTLDSTSASMLV